MKIPKNYWRELARFVIGKRIKEVEKWDSSETSTPTFVFENGDVVEFYVLDGKFGWTLTSKKELEDEIKRFESKK